MDIYMCEKCGNIVVSINGCNCGEGCMKCCGESMKLLEPQTADFALEKHVPVIERKDDEVIVRVGSIDHPMEENHYIQFIIVEKENGFDLRYLKPNEKPEAVFKISKDEKIVNVYEYCNVHGLWKA